MKKVSDRFILGKYKLGYECLGHTCEQDYRGYFAVYESVEEYLESKAVFDMSKEDIRKHAEELRSQGKFGYNIYACEQAAERDARSAQDLAREQLKEVQEVPADVPVYVVGYPYEGHDKLTGHHSKGMHIEALTTDKNLANELTSIVAATKSNDKNTEMYSATYGDVKVETLTEKTLNA